MTRETLARIGRLFIAFDERLDALAAPYMRTLRVAGYTLCFVLLCGAVALDAYQTGFAAKAIRRCASCAGVPHADIAIALVCGAAAVLAVFILARTGAATQRRLIDPLRHVRPEPATRRVPSWIAVLHVLAGIAVFFTMAILGAEPGTVRFSIKGMQALELLGGWCLGGLGVLHAFWPRYPRGGACTAASGK